MDPSTFREVSEFVNVPLDPHLQAQNCKVEATKPISKVT